LFYIEVGMGEVLESLNSLTTNNEFGLVDEVVSQVLMLQL